ncbi:hypothetical protein VNO80_06018 [Phaseolus coccineus]|uniref:Uncharacterized protein n=1 Tax=Phaseolus coccineus TaxID=3886 RepID=A0AAN9NGR6_PHACN
MSPLSLLFETKKISMPFGGIGRCPCNLLKLRSIELMFFQERKRDFKWAMESGMYPEKAIEERDKNLRGVVQLEFGSSTLRFSLNDRSISWRLGKRRMSVGSLAWIWVSKRRRETREDDRLDNNDKDLSLTEDMFTPHK